MFKPKDGEEYWTYIGVTEFMWEPHCEVWDSSPYDYIHLAAGCVFKTADEAEQALPAKYRELTGKEWSK